MAIDPLSRIPFTVAEGAVLGLTSDMLRRPSWHRPFHGIRAVDLDDESVRDMAMAYMPRLPRGAAFSHTTAAMLHGLPVPMRFSGRAPLHVTVPAPVRAPRARGIVGHTTTRPLRIALVDSFPVVAPDLALRQSASLLSVIDLAAMGCVALTGNPFQRIAPVVASEELLLPPAPGVPGAASFARAVAWMRTGAVSRAEGIVDVAARASGLPHPQPNSLQFARTGGRLGWGDEVWPEFRVGFEFQSAWHASPTRMRRDIRRLERWADEDWLVVQAVAEDVFDELPQLIHRLAHRLRSRGWRGTVRVPSWVRTVR